MADNYINCERMIEAKYITKDADLRIISSFLRYSSVTTN